jgi:anti-sigma B factor antagonist
VQDQHDSSFEIETEDLDGVRLITLHGPLDLATAPDLCMAITTARGEGTPNIVVDLSDVSFCDSRGLCALFGEERECVIAGCRLAIVVPRTSGARRIFELTSASEMLAVYPTAEAASAS